METGTTTAAFSFTGTSTAEGEGTSASNTLTGPPTLNFRKGGPKEARLNRVRMMETGRYYEAAIARGEKPGDVDNFHSLRINNLPLLTTEEQLRREFEVYGQLGDVYRPLDKDTKRPRSFFFVRYIYREHMLAAMEALNGKIINGREMRILEAKPGRYELDTSIY